MNVENKISKILESKLQTELYGYKEYFNYFISLYTINKLPKTLLLNGQKGLGKSTFAYHFINYLLSPSYDLENFKINKNDTTFLKTQNLTHPNFFLIDKNVSEEFIKIEQSRKLLNFLNKSTYQKDLKLILIDNVELMNRNSSNALLKALEEPTDNTHFILIHDAARPILETIKSRSVQFNIHFSFNDKKNILKKIAKNYGYEVIDESLEQFLYFDTPGNYLNYLTFLEDSNINLSGNLLQCIYYFIENYKTKKDINLLSFISTFVEYFYNDLSIRNSSNINVYFNKKYKILNLINDTKKFNLDIKNLLTSINKILKDETR